MIHLWYRAVPEICVSGPRRGLPLWEAGAEVAVLSLRDADQTNNGNTCCRFLDVVYRSDILKIDRTSVRGLLFHSDRVELGINDSLIPPMDSEKSNTR